MRIIFYVLIISLGATLGYREILSKKLLSKLDVIQYICLLLLLFIMGVKIGINKELVFSFHRLGLNAFIISSLSIGFSILGVKLVSKHIESKEKVDKI